MEEGKRSGKRDEWTRNEESYREKAESTRRHDSLRLFLNNNEMQSSWWVGSNYTPAIPQLTTATLLHLRHLWPLKTASSSYVYLPLVKASSLRSSSSSFLYSLLPRFSAEGLIPLQGKLAPHSQLVLSVLSKRYLSTSADLYLHVGNGLVPLVLCKYYTHARFLWLIREQVDREWKDYSILFSSIPLFFCLYYKIIWN